MLPGVRDKQVGNRPFGQGGWGRRFGKAALVFALEVWVRAQGQATGCVTRGCETGIWVQAVWARQLGQAVWKGSFGFGVGMLDKGTSPGNWVGHQGVETDSSRHAL